MGLAATTTTRLLILGLFCLLCGGDLTLCQRRIEREQGGVNLMRVEIHLGARYGTGELFRAVRRVPLR